MNAKKIVLNIAYFMADHMQWLGYGINPFSDIRRILEGKRQPVIFDVGAHKGESITRFHSYFNKPLIHAFEPSPRIFLELQKNCAAFSDTIHLNNFALSDQVGDGEFFEFDCTDLSSFQLPERSNLGKVRSSEQVPKSTIDSYVDTQAVEHVDLLKIDTQGHDLKVLIGGEKSLRSGLVKCVLLEINFVKMYEDQPELDEIFRFMKDRKFDLVAFYRFHNKGPFAGWTDALFVHHPR